MLKIIFLVYSFSLFIFFYQLDQNLKLGKVKDIQGSIMQKVEILFALQKLGEKLKPEEDECMH